MTAGLVPWIDFSPPLLAPPGTRTVFNQAVAPIGWVQDTTAAYLDCALRVHTSGNSTVTGSVNWSTWNFGGGPTVSPITLAVAQLPVHTHTVNDPTHVASDPGFNLTGTGGSTNSPNLGGGQNIYTATSSTDFRVSNVAVGATGSGNAFTPTITSPQVKFNDYMIGVKL
jgi:hypothetical protein